MYTALWWLLFCSVSREDLFPIGRFNSITQGTLPPLIPDSSGDRSFRSSVAVPEPVIKKIKNYF